MFFLPSYSPELNPDERLNADLKYAIGSKVAVRTKAKLKAAANEHMRMLENTPEPSLSRLANPSATFRNRLLRKTVQIRAKLL